MHKISYKLITLSLLISAAPVCAQLQLEWQSPAGSGPATGFAPIKPAEYLLDVDGDGMRDLPIYDKAEEELNVVSGTNRSSIIRFPFPAGWNNGKGIRGMIVVFVEITGNGPKEALVFKGPRRISDEVDQFALKTSGPIQTFGPNAILLGVGDYDNDGAEEMYIGETEKQVVEIWGPGE